MITTNNEAFAKPLHTMRLHGIDKDAWARQSARAIWRYHIATEGYKYNMTDIQAAMGLCQLMKLNKQHERRRNFAQIYQTELANFPQIRTPAAPENPNEHSWHLYIIQLNTGNRDEFVESLRDQILNVVSTIFRYTFSSFIRSSTATVSAISRAPRQRLNES